MYNFFGIKINNSGGFQFRQQVFLKDMSCVKIIKEGFRCILALQLAIVLSLLSSCTPRGEVEKLKQVEEIMEKDPVTAGSLLNFVNVSSLQGEGRARYALLRTQADYKNYVPLTSDSLIRIATNHYGTKTPSEYAALAQYYLGCTYKDMGRDLDAIDAFLRATSLFPDTTQKYYAYCQFELGRLYYGHLMFKKSQEALLVFQQYGLSSQDSLNIGYADYYLGMVYLAEGENEKAKEAYQSLLSNAKASIKQKRFAYFQLAKYSLYAGDLDSAMENIDHCIDMCNDTTSIGDALSIKGQILYQSNEYDSSYSSFMQSLLTNNKDIYTECSNYKFLASIASLRNQGDTAQFYMERYTETLDSVYARTHRSEINELMAKHTIELQEYEMEEQHSHFILRTIIIFLLMTVIGVIFLLINNKKHQAVILKYQQLQQQINNEEIERKTCEDALDESAGANITDDDCEAAADSAVAVSTELTAADYMTSLINLARDEYIHSEWPKYIAGCQDMIKAGEVMKGEKSRAFLSFLNVLFSDIFVRITADNDGLSQTDLEYCAMVMLFFKTDQMAFCAHGSNHSFHCRHAKMRERLTDEWYMLIFGKSKGKVYAALTD